jgi:Ca2+-binding RTX toxin-like protein
MRDAFLSELETARDIARRGENIMSAALSNTLQDAASTALLAPAAATPAAHSILYNGYVSDYVSTADGLTTYVAGIDGTVRAYNAETGALLQSWAVGSHLGGLAISPDGSFLMVTDRDAVSTTGSGSDAQTLVNAYRINLATGGVTTFQFVATGYGNAFADVEILANGKAYFTQDFAGSGATPIWELDPATGHFSAVFGQYYMASLTTDANAQRLLISVNGLSSADQYVAEPGVGIVGQYSGSGGGGGIQAYSADANMIVQYSGNQVYLYDATLHFERNLTTTLPFLYNATGLAFDATGQNLYAIDGAAGAIVQISTATWSVVQSVALPPGAFTFNAVIGNELLVGPEARFFLIYAGGTYMRIDNPSVADALVSTHDNDTVAGTSGNDVLIGFNAGVTLTGGAGNDEYHVDHANDVVVEAAGGGTDSVTTSVSYALGAGSEVETLQTSNARGIAAIDLTGNELANMLIGNAGANHLDGGAGDDVLTGGAGKDTLVGGAGLDSFRDTAAGLNGDTITDLSAGESIIISDLLSTDIRFELIGSTLRYDNGGHGNAVTKSGTITLANAPAGTFDLSPDPNGGSKLTFVPAIVYNQPGTASVNNGAIRSGVIIDGAGITLTNHGDIGHGVDFAQGGATFVNAADGSVSADTGNFMTKYGITGSAGADTVINLGVVQGSIALGDGDDSLTEGSNASATIDLGAGNDTYRVEGSGHPFLVANGGSGVDRVVVAATGGTVDGAGLVGFENATFEVGANMSMNLSNFSGYQSITLSPAQQSAASFSFYSSYNPLVDLALNGVPTYFTNSSLHSVTGSEDGNALYIETGTTISGDVRLGGGDDTVYFEVLTTGALGVVGGTVDGGAGTDVAEFNLRKDGEARSVDLSQFTGFEQLNFNAYYPAAVSWSANHIGADITDIRVGSHAALTISASTLTDANITLFGSTFVLAADSTVGRIGNAPAYPATIDGPVSHAEESSTVTVNGHVVGDIILNAGDDYLDARAGTVGGSIYGDAGNDTLLAGAGDDHIYGGYGNDTLSGGAGDDMLDGGVGADNLYGGTGNDTYHVDRADDLVFENAGEGTDTVISTAGYYLYANIENLTLAAGAGDIFGVGNELANTITGNEGSNLLIAGAGDDVVHGGAGVDSLFGQDGNDHLYGDAGVDYLVGGNGDDVLDGGTGADALYGEDGNDILYGGTDFQTDILVGGNGNDILHGDSGLGDYDLMDGGAGDDTYYVDTPADLTFEALNGGTDTVYANINGAGYYLYANVENLVLLGTTPYGVGNELDNHLTGNDVANYLLGGAGNDVLNGKGGNDVLFGEAGADTFVFEHGTGGDVIGDFTPGTDKIDLSAFGFADYQTIINSMHEVNGTTAIDLGGGDFIVLNGVAEASLHASDFILGNAQQSQIAAIAPLADMHGSGHDAMSHLFDSPDFHLKWDGAF